MRQTKRICVIGAGRWGKFHVQTLHELGALGGVVDASEQVRAEFSSCYPDAFVSADLEEAFKGDFDGFVIATPAATHHVVAAKVLRRGFPVLVEKPLALDLEHARGLRRLAEEKEKLLMVGHVLLFHPAIQKIGELLQSGKIGRLQYLYSNRLNLGSVRTEENILWSFAPHDISVFQFLIGKQPETVTARGAAFLQPEIFDSTVTFLRYPGNIAGHIFVSWIHPYKEHRLILVGSKGMLAFEDSSPEKQLLFFPKGIDWIVGEPVKRDGSAEVIQYDRDPPLRRELEYFIDHLHESRADIAGPDGAIEVLEILERASHSLCESAVRKKKVSLSAIENSSVHPTAIIDPGATVGSGTHVWHFSHIQSGARIGRNCSLGQNVYVGSNVTIGDYVKIQNNVSVYEGVTLEDYVFCGPSAVFTNVKDPRSKYPQRGSQHYRETRICYGASIGANATIVCGTIVGRHAFVGAGAVVTKDVADYAVVIGNPAKQVGWICECGERFTADAATFSCSRCTRRYELTKDGLVSIPEK